MGKGRLRFDSPQPAARSLRTERSRLVQMTRRRTALAVCAGLAVLASACGFGERKQQAKFLVSTASRVRTVGSATGTLTLSSVLKLPESARRAQQGGGLQLPQQLQQAEQPIAARFPVGIDFRKDRSVLLGGPVAESAFAVYDRSVVYLRRTGRGTERRPWAALDFERVDAKESRTESNPTIGILAFNPSVLLDLAAGALSGSVTKAGTETLAGVPTVRYEANFDWEKMLRGVDRENAGLRELSEDRSEALWRAYESIQISDLIFPGEIWLDGTGMPRRVKLVVEQRFRVEGQSAARNRRSRYRTTITLDLTELSAPVEAAVPARKQSVMVDTFPQLVREATRGLTAQAGSAEGAAPDQPQAPVPSIPPQLQPQPEVVR